MSLAKLSVGLSAFAVIFALYALHRANDNLQRIYCRAQLDETLFVMKTRREEGPEFARMMVDVLRDKGMFVEGHDCP